MKLERCRPTGRTFDGSPQSRGENSLCSCLFKAVKLEGVGRQVELLMVVRSHVVKFAL